MSRGGSVGGSTERSPSPGAARGWPFTTREFSKSTNCRETPRLANDQASVCEAHSDGKASPASPALADARKVGWGYCRQMKGRLAAGLNGRCRDRQTAPVYVLSSLL